MSPFAHDPASGFDQENSITEYCTTHNIEVAECVQRMRDRVRDEMNLTVSAGIAPNMVRVRSSVKDSLVYLHE